MRRKIFNLTRPRGCEPLDPARLATVERRRPTNNESDPLQKESRRSPVTPAKSAQPRRAGNVFLNGLKRSRSRQGVLFFYRGKRGTCNIKTIHRRLHGSKEVRTTKNQNGQVYHKTFEYHGIPHHDVVPGAFFVAQEDAGRVADFFGRHNVPYVMIAVKGVERSNWNVPGVDEKPAYKPPI